MELLDRARELAGDSEYVFPHAKDPTKTVNTSWLANTIYRARKRLQLDDGEPWIPRDSRRTVATNIGNLGYDDAQVRHLILGHSRGKLSETYNLAKYDRAKRTLMDAWGDDLERILRNEPRVESEDLTASVIRLRA
jgi:integrase